MSKENWTIEQHWLNDVIHKINVGDVLHCERMSAEQCREVAETNRFKLEFSGKKFLSVKLENGQAIKRVA